MAISMSELLKGADISKLDKDTQANLKILLDRINLIRASWGKSMTVTSGLRTWEDHTRIYKDLAAKKKAPFLDGKYDESKVPKKSKHLYGQAVDIDDNENRDLYHWCKANEALLVASQLWCEEGTEGWVHFQCIAPTSGKRWFNP